MSSIADIIRRDETRIRKLFHIGCANWNHLLKRIERQETDRSSDFYNEQVWTFLVGCAYALTGQEGIDRLAEALTETPRGGKTAKKAWFEVCPPSPRVKEGATRIDLAVGKIDLRPRTRSGIELSNAEPDWVCFGECKWYSDISGTVRYDMHRNQLARVIENALYFGPGEVHVTLVTPKVFRDCKSWSRLYRYKYEEYNNRRTRMSRLADDLSSSCLSLRPGLPVNISTRVANLKLHWITYEDLFQQAPVSVLQQPIQDFAAKYNGTK